MFNPAVKPQNEVWLYQLIQWIGKKKKKKTFKKQYNETKNYSMTLSQILLAFKFLDETGLEYQLDIICRCWL